MRVVGLVLVLFALGACSRQPVGNAQGGVVTWTLGNDTQMAAAAQAHCNRFGRAARMAQTLETGSIVFDCVHAVR